MGKYHLLTLQPWLGSPPNITIFSFHSSNVLHKLLINWLQQTSIVVYINWFWINIILSHSHPCRENPRHYILAERLSVCHVRSRLCSTSWSRSSQGAELLGLNCSGSNRLPGCSREPPAATIASLQLQPHQPQGTPTLWSGFSAQILYSRVLHDLPMPLQAGKFFQRHGDML